MIKGSNDRNTTRKSLRDIVIEALLSIREPVSTKDILAYIRKRGYPVLKGKTPRASIAAAVWKDINARKSKSPFKMVGPGRIQRKFSLKDWVLK